MDLNLLLEILLTPILSIFAFFWSPRSSSLLVSLWPPNVSVSKSSAHAHLPEEVTFQALIEKTLSSLLKNKKTSLHTAHISREHTHDWGRRDRENLFEDEKEENQIIAFNTKFRRLVVLGRQIQGSKNWGQRNISKYSLEIHSYVEICQKWTDKQLLAEFS